MRTIKRFASLTFFVLILVSGAAACGRTTTPVSAGGGSRPSGGSVSNSHSSPDCTRAIGGQALYRSTHEQHHPNFCTGN